VIASICCVALGAFFIWMGWRHWRYRKEETISVLEAAILKTTGVEPLPKTRLDRALTYVHAVLGLAFGSLFLFVGIFLFVSEMGLI
jgi:TRAP-type C4-dicarboxylate transport system permease small subunit